MKTLGFHHAAVQVRDVETVARFYREVLGMAELQRFHRDDGALRSVWLDTGGGGFIAVEALAEGAHGALGWSMVALRIEAQARAGVLEALQRRGVAVEKQTAWTVYVRDPEGNQVALSHHPHAATVSE